MPRETSQNRAERKATEYWNRRTEVGTTYHAASKCDHRFVGWRPFEGGNGGEQVCAKCGAGAMECTMRDGL